MLKNCDFFVAIFNYTVGKMSKLWDTKKPQKVRNSKLQFFVKKKSWKFNYEVIKITVFSYCASLCFYNIYFFITLLEAISETERCVCIVSSWSRHQSNSSSVSTAVRMEDSSEDISVVLFISLLCYNYTILGWGQFVKKMIFDVLESSTVMSC